MNEQSACERAQDIVERRAVEETVTPEDARFVAEHLATCRACGGLTKALELIAVAPSVTHQDVSAMTRRTLAQLQARRRRRHVVVGLSMAASLVVLVMVGVLSQRQPMPTKLDLLAGGVLPAGSVVGEPFTVDRDGARLRASQRTKLALTAGSSATLREASNEDVTLELAKGLVAAEVQPGASSVAVETLAGRVLVKGTVFAVEIAAAGTQVDVVRGLVEVERLGVRTAVAAGESLQLESGAKSALSQERGARITSLLTGEPVAVVPEPKEPVVAPKVVEPVTKVRPSVDWLARADACRAKRDWRCAASAYRGLMAEGEKRPEALTAAVALADLELQYLKEPRSALRHYELYLLERPGGSLEPDALFGKAMTLRALERHGDARVVLEQLLQRHPLSMYSARAEQALRELEK